MKNILLANIGNRSLIYKEKPANADNVFIGNANDPAQSFNKLLN